MQTGVDADLKHVADIAFPFVDGDLNGDLKLIADITLPGVRLKSGLDNGDLKLVADVALPRVRLNGGLEDEKAVLIQTFQQPALEPQPPNTVDRGPGTLHPTMSHTDKPSTRGALRPTTCLTSALWPHTPNAGNRGRGARLTPVRLHPIMSHTGGPWTRRPAPHVSHPC